MRIIPIIADGTTRVERTILSNGYQAFATGTWGGAKIKIQISSDATSGWLTIAELTEDNPILPEYPLQQGIYMQIVVSNSTVTTNLSLCSGYLFVMQV